MVQFAVPQPVGLPSAAASAMNTQIPILTVTAMIPNTVANIQWLQTSVQAYVNQIVSSQNSYPTYITPTTTPSWHAYAQGRATNPSAAMFSQQALLGYYGGKSARNYPDDRKLPDDWAGRIELPDGTVILGRGKAGITIEDKDAVVRYRASTRDFNRFLNASDIVEDFMRYAGSLGARRGEVLDLPLKLFIGFLLIEAATADGEPAPLVLALPPRKPRLRCVGCGQFMLASSRVAACNGSHLDRYLARTAHATA